MCDILIIGFKVVNKIKNKSKLKFSNNRILTINVLKIFQGNPNKIILILNNIRQNFALTEIKLIYIDKMNMINKIFLYNRKSNNVYYISDV